MKQLTRYVLARLREPSTWNGIVQVVSAFGVLHFTEAQTTAVLLLVSSFFITGAASVITPDKQQDETL